MNIRTHDKFYLNENYKNNPKEYFKFVKKEIEKDFGYDPDDSFKMLDVGCETGSFLTFIRHCFPNADLWGMDIMPELLDRLNSDIGNVKLLHPILGNIADEATLPDETYDVISMLGVLSIFDDFKPIISNLTKMLNDRGYIYIFSIFNPEDLDVLIKSKKSCDDSDIWESGWNLFSISSIEEYCRSINLKYEFLPFELAIDIPKHEDDPLRSWTINIESGKKMTVNGLQLIHHFYLLKLSRYTEELAKHRK